MSNQSCRATPSRYSFVIFAPFAMRFGRLPCEWVLVSGVYGLLLVILFVVLQAPDVALSMLVVTTIAYPLVVLAAIARTREGRLTDEKEQE